MSKIASTLATLQTPKPTDGAILAGAEKLMAEMSPEERDAFQKSGASEASGAEHRTEQPATDETVQPTAQFDADAYEIAVTRDWKPVRFDAGDLDVNLTPHTGLGVTNAGGQAEADRIGDGHSARQADTE